MLSSRFSSFDNSAQKKLGLFEIIHTADGQFKVAGSQVTDGEFFLSHAAVVSRFVYPNADTTPSRSCPAAENGPK
jgi:hypothetical protein